MAFLDNWLDTQTIEARDKLGLVNSPFRVDDRAVSSGSVMSDNSLPEELGQVAEPDLSSGSYVDDALDTSAQKARDDNLGFFNQLIGSMNGYNQKVLQDLMASATKAQYDYEERMSSTAYQRAVADMRKAGLNPAVLFSQGNANAASTPSVGISQVATENQLLQAISSAGTLLTGLGSVLNSLLGNLIEKTVKNVLIKYH